MGKSAKEEKSDGIVILSIGKLYTGPWDKKYWSSSRGRDRYPYPVGYKSLRTQNGVTYTMEILEGLKGPSFMISSTDGKSCSGDTPDIAWERFQKKSCSKLWNGKRFSCKIDGVEFFGFKNTFVQRLLRELVANVGKTAEQSPLPLTFSNGACETVDKLQSKASPDSDLLKCLAKSRVTGKRSRKDKVVNYKRLNGTQSEQYQQDKCTNASTSNSNQLDRSNCGYNILEKQEPSDRSRNVEVQKYIKLMPEERDGVTNIQHGMHAVNDADLCAPDTLDHAADSCSASSPKNDAPVHLIAKDTIVSDVTKSAGLVTHLLPEGEVGTSAYNTSSETCDNDSVGQEIAESMMTVLLPQALPLLKTFSRKKKKSPKPSKTPTHRSPVENKIPNISMTDAIVATELVEHSKMERKDDNESIHSVHHDSAAVTSANLDSMVPDSFDNDDPGGLLHHADASKAVQATFGLDHHAQLPINVNAEANSLPCRSGTRVHDTRTADVTLEGRTDNVLAPAEDITANSMRARFDCHSMDNLPSIHASTMKGTSRSESISCRSFSDICISEKSEASLAKSQNDTDFANCENASSNIQIPSTSCTRNVTGNSKMNDDSRLHVQQKVKLNNKLPCMHEFCACYVHPMPISMVQLMVKGDEIFMCVKCGWLEGQESTLFVYKALKNEEKMGCPSLIGHVPVALKISTNILGKDNAMGRSLIQFTPGAQSLVLLNSIRTPYCREGKLHCSCPACTSDYFEKDAVKIVRLNSGYASLVTRLKTTQAVCCLLVCEPSFLLAAEEGGKLKLWVMNCGWSEHKEDWDLPTFDCMFPSIVELKRIPKSSSLVVGHNGFGEFGLWDIEKRSLVSRFSSPGMSVLECVPAGIFRWQRKGECRTEVLIDEIMGATKAWFSGGNENHVFSPEDKDVAVGLLISSVSDPDSQCYQSCEPEATSWRLALLVNNIVIIGSAVTGGAAAVSSDGHGIIGRCDGLVYVWELSTGAKLENLHSFKGSPVSCIATETSNSGVLAIASGPQLLVYLPS